MLNLIYYDLIKLHGFIPPETLIQLTNDAPGAAAINDDILNAASARAANVIASYFFEDYVIPFSPVPPVIADIAARLTLVILWERRDAANIPDAIVEVKRGLEREMDRLRESGIPDAVTKTGETVFEAVSNKTKDDRIFGRGEMDTFRNLPLY
jgi:phage gp36-like protein